MSKTTMVGSTAVDFAGTRDEAREFVEKHKSEFPRGLTLGRGAGESSPNGDPMLFAAWKNEAERSQVTSRFAELGWDVGSQGIKRYQLKA